MKPLCGDTLTPARAALLLSGSALLLLLLLAGLLVASQTPQVARPAMAHHAFGPVLVQQATGRHSASVLLLHGLGDSGQGWAPVGPQLALPHVRFIYPTAPTRPITVNQGMRMPG